MNDLTYDEYVEQLNQEAMYRMLSNMTEVPTIKDAEEASKGLLAGIVEHCGLPKTKVRKANYALAQVKVDDANYLAFLYNINGAQIMLRATNLDTKKYYIPNDIWVAGTNENEETELHLIFSLTPEPKMNSRQYAKMMEEACIATLTEAGINPGEYTGTCLSADRTEYEVTMNDDTVRIVKSGFDFFED